LATTTPTTASSLSVTTGQSFALALEHFLDGEAAERGDGDGRHGGLGHRAARWCLRLQRVAATSFHYIWVRHAGLPPFSLSLALSACCAAGEDSPVLGPATRVVVLSADGSDAASARVVHL
jgi:hypothetical protein